MKRSLVLLIAFAAIMVACSSSQEITSSFVNKEALPENPYKKIFVTAVVKDHNMKVNLENRLAKLLSKQGKSVVKSTDLFEADPDKGEISRADKIETIKEAGCDAAFILTVLDVKTEERYMPGQPQVQAPPYRWYYYNNYNEYINYRYNQTQDPGYITREQTYFFESNFYDVASEKLLWSIQSSAFDPVDIDSWFKTYSKMIVSHLKKEKLIKK